MAKIITVVFTNGDSKQLKLPDGYDMKKLPKSLAKKYPNLTVATVDGQPLDPDQGASVTEPEVTLDTAGKKTGQMAKDAVIGTGELIGDIADGAWRFGKGFVKGVAGMDESVKAQDDAILERIKSIKY